MPTKYLDLTDLQEEPLEVVLPFIVDGKPAPRRMKIKDPSVSAMLVAEKMQTDIEVAKTKKDINSMRESLQNQVFELLCVDNEVTLVEVQSLSFAVLLKVSNWVTEHIKGVFLGGSQKPNTSDSSESKTDEKASESQSTTPSSDLAS